MEKIWNFFVWFGKKPAGFLFYRISAVLLLFTLSRFIFYILNLNMFPDNSFRSLLVIFVGGIRFDLTAVIYFNLFYIFIISLPHNLQENKLFIRYTDILFYFSNGLAFFINSADIVYYRFTGKRTSFSVFEEFKNETNYGSLVYHFLIDYYYVLIITAALILLLYLITRNQRIIGYKLSGWKLYLTRFSIMVLLLTLSIIGARGGLPPKQDFPLYPSDAGQYVEHPDDIGLVLNTPFNMIMTIDKKELRKKTYFTNQAELDSLYTPIHRPDGSKQFRKRNVFIIMVESLGRESIGFYNQKLENGTYKGYTPFLDSLCRHSYVFMNSYANSRISIEGTPAISASIPSFDVSYTLSLYSGNRIMSLASCLKEVGYSTYYFHGAPNGSLGLNSFARVAGFENYVGKTEYNNNKDYDGTWGIWDHKFLPYVADFMGNRKENFLAYIFTISSHHPFKVPEELGDKFSEGTERIYRSLSYTDFALRRFFETAANKPWFNNTLFIISGDHTCWPMHHPEYQSYVGYFTVPIIFYEPDGNLQGIDSVLAQQIDIMPTVLNYLGYPKPYFAFGQDLFKSDREKFTISYIGKSYQLLQNNWLLQFNENNSTALFDVSKDIYTGSNLIGRYDSVQHHMEKYAHAFLQQYFTRLTENKMVVE